MPNTKGKPGRKADVVYKLLDTLADASMTVSAMIGATLQAGYGASAERIQYIADKNLDESIGNLHAMRMSRRRQYQRYSMMVRYLKNNGMMRERRVGETIKVYLTKEGRKHLATLRKERRENMPGYGYDKSPGKKVVIVSYDIPEKARKHRDWLRAVLKRIGLEAMQRSVWVGKVAVPRRLVEDLALRRMTQYVEIVEVGSTGTFKRLD